MQGVRDLKVRTAGGSGRSAGVSPASLRESSEPCTFVARTRVDHGSVLRSANHVRITAQLIHAATDPYVSAESYERHLRDLVALQDEVARDIANAIIIKLTPREKAKF